MQATLEKPAPARQFREHTRTGNDLKDLVPNPRIILDCGGGKGWFARTAFQIWPEAEVHTFEPASRFRSEIKPVNERHHIHHCALGEYDGEATLYLTNNPESNSLLGFLPSNPLESAHDVIGQETVEIHALDSIIVEGVEHVDILKMDVQGAELRVLQGARNLLEKARPVIYMEVSFQPLYQSHPVLEQVDDYLDFLGYRRLYLYPSPCPEIWGDAVYVPKDWAGGKEHDGKWRCDSTPMSDKPLRLNIGAGETVIPGFTAIDRKLGTEAFPLPYADNSVDEIRCSHMLEHLSYRDADAALTEWNRVLKPGGRLRLSVPDIDKVKELTNADSYDQRWRFYLMGGQTDDGDFHRSAYDYAVLQSYLERAGFERVQEWTSPNTDSAALPISLNLEAFKPAKSVKQPTNVKVKVRAIIGMPRIGWNDTWQSIIDAMHKLGIPIETHQGCFWWQNMQQGLNRALRDGIDWIVTLDYDSMILPHHVERLLQILGNRPDIDAIAALQMRRGAETPLFSTGKTLAEFDGQPYRVNTAHFGLTAIRVQKLATIPKPWLIDQPDANGDFGGDHTDADITFWKKWTAAGNNIYVAPDVRIGHLELLVSEFDENYQPRHYQIGKWWNMHTEQGHCMRTTKEI